MRSIRSVLMLAGGVCLLLTGALACGIDLGAGGSTTVEGRVTDEEGFSAQRFGGEGAVSAATRVEARALSEDGSWEVIGEGSLRADGSYSLEVPAGERRVVVAALSEQGAQVTAVILEATGDADTVTPCAPMTTETTLEAEVLREMLAQTDADAVDPVDVRARIDARTAAAVRSRHEAEGDADVVVRALAEGVLAAQRAELEAYAEAGFETTQSALLEAELSAASALNRALHEAQTPPAEAYASFDAALAALLEARGIRPEEQARAESCASVSFRATVDARLSADDAAAVDDARERALLSAAWLEARAHAEATVAVLEAAGAADALIERAAEAGAELRSSVALSSTTSAAARAFAAYSVSVIGEGSVEGSLLGSYLGLDLVAVGASEAAVQAAVEVTQSAAADGEAELSATLDDVLSSSDSLSAEAVATEVVTAYRAYVDAVAASRAALDDVGLDDEATFSLLLLAEGGFWLEG